MTLPPGEFATILADPPWRFLTYSGHGTPHRRRAGDHYATMSMAELVSLPVEAAAAKDAILLVWTYGPFIPHCLELGRAWGFTYKTDGFVWVKTKRGGWPRPGMGYYTRKGAEPCLLFTRGAPRRLNRDVEQVIFAPRGRHSAKPEEQYGRIERLSPGPHLELFARAPRPGWVTWGDEAEPMGFAA